MLIVWSIGGIVPQICVAINENSEVVTGRWSRGGGGKGNKDLLREESLQHPHLKSLVSPPPPPPPWNNLGSNEWGGDFGQGR